MSESDNEVSRMDQLENSLAKIEEQLQALTTTMANMAAPRAGGNSESMRREEPPVGLRVDLPDFDDDMADYAARRTIGSQEKLQKLRDQVESVTRKMQGKDEDLLDYEAMTFEE